VLETLDIHCSACGATLTVEAHLRTANCPYCDSPSVVERPPSTNRPDPMFVLGFGVVRERAESLVQRWIKSRGVFAHSGLKTATLEKIRGVYLPAYLYGAIADTDYDAQIGENYTVTETYTTTDSKGRAVTRTRTVVKTEWRHLSGQHTCYVLDVLVTASNGIPNAELEAVEPFDLRALRRYTPAVLSGWIAEEPSVSKDDCFGLAHDESVEKVGDALGKFMPGDSYRDLNYRTTVRDEVIDLVLLPIWVFAARYAEDKPPVRILVNGQTGEVQGRVPLSKIKITVAILCLVGAIAIVVFAVTGGLR
jgi:DNA-directed RNA polymerase subunit RPC12/RpoP